jgi:hypothetical protein
MHKKWLSLSRFFTVVLLSMPLFILTAARASPKVPDPVPQVSNPLANELANSKVPDISLDLYLYFHQGSPFLVEKNLIPSPTDIHVDSLAIWGVANGTRYTVGGALTFSTDADASFIYSQIPPWIPKQYDLWTKLSNNIIYFVKGSGDPADRLISAISNNKFIRYDDSQALGEVSTLPDGNTTTPFGVAIFKPTQAALNLLKPYIGTNSADTIDSIFTWVKPEVIAVGLYSSQQIDVGNLIQNINNNTFWEADIGGVVSINSSVPGFLFSLIASKYMETTKYTKVRLGDLTAYKVFIDGGWGRTIPVLINVSGNHIFATVSEQESYADTLMKYITR